MPQTKPICSAPTLAETFKERVRELWPEGLPKRAVLAVSGGADSTALAVLARSFLNDSLDRVVIAHFQHHLRGEEAEVEARFVETLARDLGLPFVRGDWSPENRSGFDRPDRNLQAAARRARYEFLIEAAGSHRCPVIFTAHHSRDQVETILHNLSRGGGSGAYRGIRPRLEKSGVWILRPLLWSSPEELRDYLVEHDQPHCEDSSNASLKYRRNWIRHQLLPRISEANPNFEHDLLLRWETQQAAAKESYEVTESIRARGLRREGEWVLPLSDVQRLDPEARVDCLRHFLRDLVGEGGWDPIRRTPLESLLGLIEAGTPGVVNLPGGIRAEVEGRALKLRAEGSRK